VATTRRYWICIVVEFELQELSLRFSSILLVSSCFVPFLLEGWNLMINLGVAGIQYLPIEGLAAFNKATAELLLGADNAAIKENRVSIGLI